MEYSGLKAKIPLGEYGILTDVSPDKAPYESLTKATNVVYFNGYVEKASGSIKWNTASAVSNSIIGAHYWIPNAQILSDYRMIALTSDGNIYKGQNRVFGTPINTTIASVLTPNVVFADGGQEQATNPRKLFIFTGGATLPYVLSGDGTAATVISAPNSDWTSTGVFPKTGVIHRGQLWAFAGQISYASDALNHESFNNVTTSLTEPVYPGEGGEIRGGFVYKTKLFCFKDGGYIYSLNDSDSNNGNWYWQRVAANFGLAAPNAIAEVLDDMVVGNTYGTLTSFQATFALGSVEAADIMQMNGFDSYIRNYLSKSGVTSEHLLYYAEKKQLFMTARSAYQTSNDSLIVLDYGRQGKVRPSIWQKGSPQCLAHYKDIFQVERPMYGGGDGYLYLMDWQDRLEGNSAYTGLFRTQQLDFSFVDSSLSSLEKHFDFIAVHYIPTNTAATLLCDYYVDGYFMETVTFYLAQNSKPTLGTMELGVDRFADGNSETYVQKIYGTGRTLTLVFYNSGSNQNFQVPAITVYFTPGGDKVQE